MYKKVLNILLNYYKAINSKEVVELVLTPVLICIISYMFFNSSINKEVVISLKQRCTNFVRTISSFWSLHYYIIVYYI